MSAFVTLNPEDLESGADLTEDEVGENDANCEIQESGKVFSPFSNMLANLLSGGGRTRRQKIASKG